MRYVENFFGQFRFSPFYRNGLRLALLLGIFSSLLNPFPLHAQPESNTALRFNGTNSFVTVPHSAALNAFPLTVTAWVKTLRNTNIVDGIVSKYFDGSGNGYTVVLQNGTLFAFYSRLGGNQVFTPPTGINGGFIADGNWHHIAFAISPTGGQLFVDGTLKASLGWTGTAGVMTSTEPLQIGRYHTYPNTFQGEIDDVTLWNRALPSSEINYLKHRKLGGVEDGLLGYWRFNEGSDTVANNTATNAFHGTLINAPAWVESHAPVSLEPIAANGLKFNGTSGSVEVNHHNDLNGYPFTASAWFRTTNGAANVQGIVSKYADGTGNGWTLVVQNGRLRGFYYRNFSNRALDVTSAGSVADGAWHHAAMTVDLSGGKLFLDGVLVGSNTWTGTPGAPTGTEPLQLGHYNTVPERLFGAIDEVAVWNRALTTNEIASLKNLPLAGDEANLVAYWRLDEGTDTTTADATGFGHTGTLVNNATWIGSTAYLGDGSVHLIAAPGIPNFTRQYAVTTAPGKNSFTMTARSFVRRFYDFGATPSPIALTVKFDGNLQTAGSDVLIPTKPNTVTNNLGMTSYNASSPQPTVGSSIVALASTVHLEPDGAQLDSINSFYEGVETVTHSEDGGPFISDGSDTSAATRLLHFNGTIIFGPLATVITNIANVPAAGNLFAPDYVQSLFQVGVNGGSVSIYPNVKFGGGGAFTVNLGTDGTATNVNGSFSLAAAGQFFEAAGVRYQLPGATLGPAGMTATTLLVWFPTGFGMTTSTNNRDLQPYLRKSNVVLDGNLLPNTNSIIFTAATYNTNRLYFSEETKPFLIGATQIEWRIPEGEFFLSQADTVEFVREKDDNDLASQAPNLINTLAADRISNDGYYRHVTAKPGIPIFVRPDANGAALLTMEVDLQENEYRPHFPYLSRSMGGHIPVIDGTLIITNDLIDPSSRLLLAGPVPVPYARDCGTDACSGAATIAPQILSFTPPLGEMSLPQLNFTPDGGLLAYGTIPATNLTWGFAGGANFAQRTSDVTTGAYRISGTYFSGALLQPGDLNAEQDYRRPVRLLLTGYGSSNDVTYVERPGEANYADGFANYAGLNFRAPTQGRSFIAGTDTGLYPLTARSKYYVRFGGVSGIHESASFPANLTLYGYPFTFHSYRLSFLDSANEESRTDGVISLPIPSGFPVEFERMKFLCRGNLDSARLPSNIDTKHLVYWNTDLSLLSLQFKPRANNACSLTERYLVLGVETKLPFIPQALHAALAIKANGNLATAATGVEGVDSRFAVPANLQLQGPGGSFYPITTAGDGYFNNWETPNRPASGFYSLVGRIRVPFFRDVKTQFHVTPTGPNTAQVNLMGGWPSEEGTGLNRGWNNGTQNYFNTAKFDQAHDGWPVGVTIGNYRVSPDEQFRQRAQQNWIDVANFDYPLTWNSVLREFSGFATAKVILPVIDVDSRLKQISPGKVDFDFAQDIKLELPRIKVLDFANDALNEINAPINTLSNAITSALGAAFNTSGLTSGFRGLQNVMRENAEGLFRPVLQPALDPVVDNLYVALSGALSVSRANLLAQTPSIVNSPGNGLQTAILNLNGTAGDASKIFGKLNGTLMNVDDTLGLFIRVLEKDGGGKRHVVRTIIQKLIEDQGPALGFVASLGEEQVNGLLGDLEPTLAKIEGELVQLRAEFGKVRLQISAGDFANSLNAVNHTSATLQSYSQLAGTSVSNLLSATVGNAGDYFTADPARAKREIKERLTIAFLSSSLAANYQTSFRQFLSDKNSLLTQLTDVLFDQVNRSIRDGLSSAISGATDELFQGMKGAGMGSSLLSAKIRGAPTFEGDSLRRIHLDSEIKMNLPDEMTFMAYMDIKELNSQSTALSCIPNGGPAAEVTLGAKDIPLDWLGVSGGGPLALNIEARWTLQSSAVLGIGGSFEVIGKVGFKGVSINNFGASLAIGQFENYFAAKAGATVTIIAVPVDFNVGIFAGHACSIDPLKFIDPEAAEVLIENITDFTGVYLQFGARVSLSDILFGSSSCLLDVTVSANNALYYQGGPRFGIIGGRQKMGVSADLICIISAEGSYATGYRLDTEGKLTLAGKVRLCVKVGACPFCVKACGSVGIKGIIGTGGIDYSIDTD